MTPETGGDDASKTFSTASLGVAEETSIAPIASFDNIAALLGSIHTCRLCSAVIPSKVTRSIIPSWNAELVLMAQAPSEHGVRLSGVHWVDAHGNLRPLGGTYLESYLRRVGYSINPREQRLPRPYTTNVLQCWPGAGPKRDRPPGAVELSNCSKWWQSEVKLLKPKAVVLLGKPSAEAFIAACNLSASFNTLLESQGTVATFAGGSVPVFTVPHPTAPYKGPRGGRSEYYELAFAALNGHLHSSARNRGA